MALIDIIPDIHGQIDKLRGALASLGWRRGPSGWHHPEPDRGIVFLGDFIDRGPDNRAVIDLVRSLMDAGRARAIMGNHEFNALQLHTVHPETGRPLRARSPKNLAQHETFLRQFPFGAPQTREVLDWMQGLPLFLDGEGFRAVHACWIDGTVAALRREAPAGVLTCAQLVRAADPGDPLFALAEEITKGPEQALPAPFAFADKDGHVRRSVRLRWWQAQAQSWRDVAISVPDPAALPRTPLPAEVRAQIYPAEAPPVFFGHYWLSGPPVLQAPNALCLDYSAGTDGPLVSYPFEPGEARLEPGRIRVHA